jgi:hypothetical protein
MKGPRARETREGDFFPREGLPLGEPPPKGLHTCAARLWAEALAEDPKLADDRRAQPRPNAARSAALAGSGQGKDDPSVGSIPRPGGTTRGQVERGLTTRTTDPIVLVQS